MSDFNKANREVCDVDIRILSTKKPFLKFDLANTTTTGIEANNVYAMGHGARRITFQDPLTGTMSIEAQVYPFKLFALMSDGTIETTAAYADSQTIKCTTGGQLTVAVTDGTIETGTVFVYPEDSFGDDAAQIAGAFSDGVFTATTASEIAAGESYVVGYIVSRTNVKKITLSNKKLPKDYYITMKTLDKDEEGCFTPFVQTIYKASIQRNFELAFSSEGDPASITLTFDLSEDDDGNFMDMVEVTSERQ